MMRLSVRSAGRAEVVRSPVERGRIEVWCAGVRVEVTEDPATGHAVVRIDPSDFVGDMPIRSDRAVETEDLSMNSLQVRWRGWAGK